MAAPVLSVGQTLGNYVVRSLLGEGGMGIVYLAEHPLIGRRVAIKVIHPDLARNPETVRRFEIEAQAVNKIGHPNIVDITDFAETEDGARYFVMEHLSGESLGARLKRQGKLAILDALYIAQQVADALAASHAAGILHRDLKPDNVHLITRGGDAQFVKVLDFGLAKLVGAGSPDRGLHKTRTGSLMGTPYYMAPEQCAGKGDIDARADVYSLGVILFEMLAGRVPFAGDGYGEVIVKHMTEPPPRLADERADCPAWLDELVARTLVKERRERVGSMDELRETITSCLAGGDLPKARKGMSAPSLLGSAPRPAKRSRAPMLALVAGFVVVGGAATVWLLRDTGATPEPAPPPAPVASPPAETSPAPAPVAAPPPAAAARPREVTIRFESDPPGATVRLADGRVLGTTPFDWRTPRSDTPVDVTLSKVGYEPRSRELVPRSATSVLTDLEKLAAPSRSSSRPSPARPVVAPIPAAPVAAAPPDAAAVAAPPPEPQPQPQPEPAPPAPEEPAPQPEPTPPPAAETAPEPEKPPPPKPDDDLMSPN